VVLNAEDGSFQTYNFKEWHDISQQQPHPESISTISFRIRVPRVIVLMLFDRVPKKEVKFTRHNIFERDTGSSVYVCLVKAICMVQELTSILRHPGGSTADTLQTS
jgi:5-methylcytosine-specific restriction endonuclease McrA